MYFILILFFGSLLGIIFMIGKKLAMLKNGAVLSREEITRTPYLEEWKQSAAKNIKRHGYRGLVATIRFYVRSTNHLKNKYQEIKTRAKNISGNGDSKEKKEASKFLKKVSEYKQKIGQIKHKIREEEKNS